MNSQYCLIQTTAGSETEAEELAQLLVRERLAACVQVLPITSYYRWEGKISKDGEWLLSIKTRAACYQAVEKLIIANHAYETPEIIQLPVVDGSEDYLQWVDNSTDFGD